MGEGEGESVCETRRKNGKNEESVENRKKPSLRLFVITLRLPSARVKTLGTAPSQCLHPTGQGVLRGCSVGGVWSERCLPWQRREILIVPRALLRHMWKTIPSRQAIAAATADSVLPPGEI